MLKVKDEYIDCNITEPVTGKIISVKFDVDPSSYEYYYANGYQHLFDVVPPVVKEKPKTKTDDISE